MSFITLLYHEIRETQMLQAGKTSQIVVKQDYEDKLPSPLFVTEENFQMQMEYLHRNNFHTLTLKEVMDFYYLGVKLPDKSVLITFDDCYQSIKYYAYPILKKYGFHATSFVVTGWLNDTIHPLDLDRSVCLTTSELIEMSDVFSYGNHTHHYHTRSNPTTSKIMMVSEEEFIKDLEECNQYSIISNKDVFAYPFGLYTIDNVNQLRSNGYKLAFTSETGWNLTTTDPLLLKRNVIPYFMDFKTFEKLVNETTNEKTK